jgi:NADH dehydrogenase [ubiquinone] 1 alpha subcomplex assembly factor 7
MTELEREIRRLIQTDGPMPISRYMALCADHYYATRDPFGARGDFITAPEVSQMFGELVGLWAAAVWQMMRSPAEIVLVELGPGRGTLMADALRAASTLPAFRAALRIHLVETSAALVARQETLLADAGVPVAWHRRVDEVPKGPSIVIANEFVDALPIDQLVRTEAGWRERRIGLRDGQLISGLDPVPLPGLPPAEVGAVLERRDVAPLRTVAARLAAYGGAALVVDYGHVETDFGDTLQALQNHRPVDLLETPGEADLTAHVDFAALADAAAAAGVLVHGPVTQGEFLRGLGIEARAARLQQDKDDKTKAAVDAALARLTGPAPGMGELFKATAFSSRDLATLPAFDGVPADRERQP